MYVNKKAKSFRESNKYELNEIYYDNIKLLEPVP